MRTLIASLVTATALAVAGLAVAPQLQAHHTAHHDAQPVAGGKGGFEWVPNPHDGFPVNGG